MAESKRSVVSAMAENLAELEFMGAGSRAMHGFHQRTTYVKLRLGRVTPTFSKLPEPNRFHPVCLQRNRLIAG